MQFMKHLVAAAALTVAGSAMAETYEGGTLTVGAPDSLIYLAVSYTGTPKAFSDVINFDLASDVTAQFNLKPATFSISQISGLSLEVYNGTTLLAPTAGLYTLLAGNAYSFHVSGTTSGLGAYSVNYYLTPAPAVPEAGSVAMTLAGLGVVGLVAARRRRA